MISSYTKTRKARLVILFTCLYGFVCSAGALGADTAPPAPDPELINDVLQGHHLIEERDDISILRVYQQGSNMTTGLLSFDTSNSVFSNPTNPQKNEIVSGYQANSAAATASGRMFNTVNDDVVTFSSQSEPEPSGNIWLMSYTNTKSGNNENFVIQPSAVQPPAQFAFAASLVVMGNFVTNGVQQAVALYGTGPGNWGMSVLGAPDPNQHGVLTLGPQYFNPAGFAGADPTFSTGSMVVGDFNNDGRDEIAIYMVAGLMSQNPQAFIEYFSVDPQTFAITFLTSTSVPFRYPQAAALCAGHFTDSSHLDLVMLGQTGNENTLRFDYIRSRFDSNKVWAPQYVTTSDSSVANSNIISIFAHAAPIIPPCAAGDTNCPQYGFGPEQLVVATSTEPGPQGFWIGDFTEAVESDNTTLTYQFTQKSYTRLSTGCTVDMKLGNFDNQTSAGSYNPALQLGVLEDYSDDCNHIGASSGTVTLKIININVPPSESIGTGFQQNNWLQDSTYVNPVFVYGIDQFPRILQLAVGDLQGRSIRLGAPEVVRITKQIQPQLILGLPPMHVDYATPLAPDTCQTPGTQPPCIYNLTVRPTAPKTSDKVFASSFNFSSSSSSSLKNQDTTSWGFSEKTTVGAQVSLTDGIESGSDSLKDSLSSLYKSTVVQTYQSSSANTDTLSGTTGFSDLLLYRSRGMNVFYYPVLNSNYTPDNPKTQYVEFSIPTTSALTSQSGTDEEWYQPVQEPGNALTYPWSETLLKNSYGQPLKRLSGSGTCKATDDSGEGFQATWINSSDTSEQTGSVSAFSNDLSMSESVGAGISSVFGASVSFGLNLNVSTSLNSLNVEANTLDSSDGVAGTKPGFSNTRNSVYDFATYILGQPPQQTSQDSISIPQVGLQTQGPIYLNFTTNVNSQGPGGDCTGSTGAWWGSTYTVPDIGFNHPARWLWNGGTDRVSFNPPPAANRASNPITTPFYWMKGFFIQSTASQQQASQQPGYPYNLTSYGPNLTEAQFGDQLALSVRVYNFSLVDTNALVSNTIYVDFYAQTYCASVNDNFTQLCGNSIPLGRAQISSIPGYESASNGGTQPNWSLATIQFNTGNYPQLENQHMMFWTVTWMQDANGNLIKEMPAHGLTAVPNGGLAQVYDTPVELYSNNVGAYAVHSPFFVAPVNSASTAKNAPPAGRLGVPDIQSGPPVLAPYASVPIKVRFTAIGGELRNVTVRYYDGSPSKGGTLIDRQTLHRIRANASVLHLTMYQPQSCGVHTIYADAYVKADDPPISSQPLRIKVEVDPVARVGDMIAYVRAMKLQAFLERPLLANLTFAQQRFREGSTGGGIATLRVFSQLLRLIPERNANRLQDQTDSLLAQTQTIITCEQILPGDANPRAAISFEGELHHE